MEVRKLSDRFSVRKLDIADAALIFDLTRRNLQFYEYCGRANTLDDIYADLTVVPPGKTMEDKYYVGFFDGAVLVAVMDLISGYPNETTAFIGFFMLNVDEQGRGVGSQMISECCTYLKRIGFAAVQLGFDRDNPQARHFWHKNSFADVRECPQEEGVLVLAERTL